MLRHGVPTSGQIRDRDTSHSGRRKDGSRYTFSGRGVSYDVRIPAVGEIAQRVGCRPLTKRNWITFDGHLFSRVRAVRSASSSPFVYDLRLEGDEPYMTTVAIAAYDGKLKKDDAPLYPLDTNLAVIEMTRSLDLERRLPLH